MKQKILKKSELNLFWVKTKKHIPTIIAFLGLIYYSNQGLDAINYSVSSVYDEAGYMTRGFQITSGQYWPYEDYSPFLDHMPLSFIIPGFAQIVFGPGIGTGRYFALAISILGLIGLWFTARAISSKWAAALSIWVIALNPAWIESFSLGYSQGLILLISTWALFFTVGKTRKPWQIVVASSLAGLAAMTRLNMFPMVFFLIGYFFWQHGKKAGIISLIASFTPIIILHLLFLPGILKLWSIFLPEWILPSPNLFKSVGGWNYNTEISYSGWIGNPDHIIWDIIKAFWAGVQTNLIAIIGVFIAIILWPKRKNWESNYHFRLGFFLVSLYLTLFFIHMWTALSGKSCRLVCFKGYLMFFNHIAILFIILALSSWKLTLSKKRYLFLFILLSIGLIIMFFYGIGIPHIIADLAESLINIEIPRMKNLRFIPGTIPIWSFVENKFNVDQNQLKQSIVTILSIMIPILVIWGILPLIRKVLDKIKIIKIEIAQPIMLSILSLVLLVSPSAQFGGKLNITKCENNVIDSHENVAQRLKSIIPEEAKVYWGIESLMLLLYLHEIEIFPSQMMIHYTYIANDIDGEIDEMLKFGYWNEELKEKWILEADNIFVEGRFYKSQWKSRVESGELIVYEITAPVEICRGDDSRILVLIPNPDRD